MKRIDQLQEQTKAQEQAYAWGKIAVVFSALIGWLLLATVIGGNDPSGSLWWLQIIIFITVV